MNISLVEFRPYGQVSCAVPFTTQPPTTTPHGVIAGHAVPDLGAVAKIVYVPLAPLAHCAAPD